MCGGTILVSERREPVTFCRILDERMVHCRILDVTAFGFNTAPELWLFILHRDKDLPPK